MRVQGDNWGATTRAQRSNRGARLARFSLCQLLGFFKLGEKKYLHLHLISTHISLKSASVSAENNEGIADGDPPPCLALLPAPRVDWCGLTLVVERVATRRW